MGVQGLDRSLKNERMEPVSIPGAYGARRFSKLMARVFLFCVRGWYIEPQNARSAELLLEH
jgi:hypothetical protein